MSSNVDRKMPSLSQRAPSPTPLPQTPRGGLLSNTSSDISCPSNGIKQIQVDPVKLAEALEKLKFQSRSVNKWEQHLAHYHTMQFDQEPGWVVLAPLGEETIPVRTVPVARRGGLV